MTDKAPVEQSFMRLFAPYDAIMEEIESSCCLLPVK